MVLVKFCIRQFSADISWNKSLWIRDFSQNQQKRPIDSLADIWHKDCVNTRYFKINGPYSQKPPNFKPSLNMWFKYGLLKGNQSRKVDVQFIIIFGSETIKNCLGMISTKVSLTIKTRFQNSVKVIGTCNIDRLIPF